MKRSNIGQFLALSTASGFFEIGAVFLGTAISPSLLPVVTLALAYQIGTLFPYPLPLEKSLARFVMLLALTSGILVAFDASNLAFAVLFIMSVSILINVSRVNFGKTEVSTSLKRTFRVLGFIISPLIVHAPILMGVLLLVVLSSIRILSDTRQTGWVENAYTKKDPIITATLITHQMHYFCYYCVVITTLISKHGAFTGLITFVAGWISYIATPHLLPKTKSSSSIPLIGHILLVPVLTFMYMANDFTIWSTFLWILTGFFGGTVVFLTSFARRDFGFQETYLASVENIGHCLGMACALLWVLLGLDPSGLYGVAAALALSTALLLGIAVRSHSGKIKSRQHD